MPAYPDRLFSSNSWVSAELTKWHRLPACVLEDDKQAACPTWIKEFNWVAFALDNFRVMSYGVDAAHSATYACNGLLKN